MALSRNNRYAGTHLTILSVPLAVIAGLFLFPNDPSVQNSLFLSGWILALGIAADFGWTFVSKGWGAALRAELLVQIGIIVVVIPELIQRGYSVQMDPSDVRRAFLAVGVFSAFVAMGSMTCPFRLPVSVRRLATREYNQRTVFSCLLISFGLCMLNYIIGANFSLSALVDGLLANRWDAPWGGGGDASAFRIFLTNFGYIVPLSTVILAVGKQKRKTAKVITGTICSVIIIGFQAQSGSRRIVAAIIGAALLMWLYHARARKVGIGQMIAASAVAIVSVVVMQFMLSVRDVGLSEFATSSNQQIALDRVSVDDNFRFLAETIRLVPREQDFLGWEHLWFIAIRPVPRLFWPGKPTGESFDIAAALGEKGVSITFSSIGEWYLSFGWLGVAAGGLSFGMLARWWSQLLDGRPTMTAFGLHALGAMGLIVGLRSLVELVLATYPILCWIGINGLMRIVRGSGNGRGNCRRIVYQQFNDSVV